MHGVPGGPELEEGGAAARPRPLDGGGARRVDRAHVHAVHRLGGEAEPLCPPGEVAPQHLPDRGGDGVSVVLAREDHRQMEDHGEVERFEQHPLVHGPVAEERDRDPILPPDLERERRAAGHGSAGPHDAVRSVDAEIEVRDVHGAAASAVVAALPAEQLREHPVRGAALGENMAVPAVGARNHVVRAKGGADPDRDPPPPRCIRGPDR